MAQWVSAGTQDRHGPDLLSIEAKLWPSAKAGDIEKIIEGEIKSLGTLGPSEAETEKARRRARSTFITRLQSNEDRALMLGEYELFGGDAQKLAEEISHYLKVKPEDIKRVVAEYLGPTRRTIVETYPPEPPTASNTQKPKEDRLKPSAVAKTKNGAAPPHAVHKTNATHKRKGAAKPAAGKKPKPVVAKPKKSKK